jgi:hypothetical protein
MLCCVHFPLLYMSYIYVNSPIHGVHYCTHKYEAGSSYIYNWSEDSFANAYIIQPSPINYIPSYAQILCKSEFFLCYIFMELYSV